MWQRPWQGVRTWLSIVIPNHPNSSTPRGNGLTPRYALYSDHWFRVSKVQSSSLLRARSSKLEALEKNVWFKVPRRYNMAPYSTHSWQRGSCGVVPQISRLRPDPHWGLVGGKHWREKWFMMCTSKCCTKNCYHMAIDEVNKSWQDCAEWARS